MWLKTGVKKENTVEADLFGQKVFNNTNKDYGDTAYFPYFQCLSAVAFLFELYEVSSFLP